MKAAGLLLLAALGGCGMPYARPIAIVDPPFPPAPPGLATRPPPPDDCGASRHQDLRGRDWDQLARRAEPPVPGRWRMLWWSETSADAPDPERTTIRVNAWSRIVVSVRCE